MKGMRLGRVIIILGLVIGKVRFAIVCAFAIKNYEGRRLVRSSPRMMSFCFQEEGLFLGDLWPIFYLIYLNNPVQ